MDRWSGRVFYNDFNNDPCFSHVRVEDTSRECEVKHDLKTGLVDESSAQSMTITTIVTCRQLKEVMRNGGNDI